MDTNVAQGLVVFQPFLFSHSVSFDIYLAVSGVSKLVDETLRGLIVKGATIFGIYEIFCKALEVGLFFTTEVTLSTVRFYGLVCSFLVALTILDAGEVLLLWMLKNILWSRHSHSNCNLNVWNLLKYFII